MDIIGLIAFSDPPRGNSAGLLAELRSLGVRTVMVTGDAVTTASTIAHAIGLEGAVCPPGRLPDTMGPDDFAVYAGVFPEDKFRLVKAFQRRGHVVGMCGDGANDAPALRQAQMGIAVSTATDVAKAAAGIVLTEPGLGGIVTCIKEGRSAFQRVLTYTLSILVNKCATLIVMGAGLVMTGHAVLTPLLQALSMLAGDFVTMSQRSRSSEALAISQHVAGAKPNAGRGPAGSVQVVVLCRPARGRLVPAAPEHRRDADSHVSDAGSRRSGECVCAARAWPFLAVTSRLGHDVRLRR